MSAVTDSGNQVRRGEGKEGIANLIEIMSIATGEPEEVIEGRYDGGGYGTFKKDVAEAVIEMLRPVRERHAELRADDEEVRRRWPRVRSMRTRWQHRRLRQCGRGWGPCVGHSSHSRP